MQTSTEKRSKKRKKNAGSVGVETASNGGATSNDGPTAAKGNEMRQETNGANGSDDRNAARDEAAEFERNVEETAKEVVAEAEKAAAKAAKEAEKAVKKADKAAEKAEKSGASATKTISVAEYDKLVQERDEAKDRGLRALAELENFRARTNRLAQEERKYASLDLARAILPVWDNMGRAIEAAEQSENPERAVDSLVEGVKMMSKEFLDILAKFGVERIDALHRPFDPNFHESIAFMPNDEFPANTVVVEARPGFKMKERVVRPTQVVLAAPSPK